MYWTRCTSSLYCRFSSLVGLGCLAANCFFKSSSTSLTSPAVPLISRYKAHPFFASEIAVCAAASRVSGSMLYPFSTSDNRSMMIAPALPIRIVSIFFSRAQMPLYLSAQTSSCVFNLASKSSTIYPFSFCNNFYPRGSGFIP